MKRRPSLRAKRTAVRQWARSARIHVTFGAEQVMLPLDALIQLLLEVGSLHSGLEELHALVGEILKKGKKEKR